MKTDSERTLGFSRIDLMVVLAMVAVLVVVEVMAAGNLREGSQTAVCMNQPPGNG